MWIASESRLPSSDWSFCMGNFEAALAFGQQGEKTVSEWLQGRGHMVFPAYEKEGGEYKGPQLFSKSGDLVLPDLLAMRDGKAIWFEVKRKTCFAWHRKSRKWHTGIDLHHYEQYKEVAARTEFPVWLVFLHPSDKPSSGDIAHGCPQKCPAGLFGNNIDFLAKNESHRHANWGRHGMVYWSRDSLLRLAGVRP